VVRDLVGTFNHMMHVMVSWNASVDSGHGTRVAILGAEE